MFILIIISSIWVFCGAIYLFFLSINPEKTLKPLKDNLLILQKFVDRTNGKYKNTREYITSAEPPITNFKIPQPLPEQSKFIFYFFLYIKLLLFYWIFYLIIIAVGTILSIIDPTLLD